MSEFDNANEVECISFNNVVGLFEGSVNPTLGAGFEGPSGSVLIRHADSPEIWQKQSDIDTDWILIATGNDLVSLSGAIDILSGDITFLSGAIDSLSSDVVSNTNNIAINSGAIINNTTNIASNSADIIDLSGQISGTVSGGVEFIDDLLDVDTSTYIPTTGDFLRWNGNDWIPSSSPEVTGIPVSNNLVYAYDTLIQTLNAINIFQIITFDNIVVAEGWSYSAGNFTSDTGGAFMATFEFNVEKNGGGNVEVAVKANQNGTEIAGSHNGMDVTSNNTAFSVSRTFLFITEPNDVINFLMAGNNTTARLVPAPTVGGINTPTGATLLIRRIV